jgi:glycerol-3-phosphate dehydrogenase
MIRDIQQLGARTFDLLVIGGGVYGLTVAADAAQRGLSVALVERGDFGAANSFNHLRTIHGGLRYLQTLDVKRARESIRERRTLARIAPDLVRPVPFVLPLTSRFVKGPAMMRMGFLLDRLIAHDRNRGVAESLSLPPGRVLSASRARDRFPGLGGQRLVGAAVWYDYLTTESDRLTFSWAVAAAAYGATLANYVNATSLLLDGRRIAGARAVDQLTDRLFEIAARVVVNATGADLDALLRPAQADTRTPMLRAMNLVTRLPGGEAAIGGQAPSGRTLFMVPWRGRALFGTWESSTACAPDAVLPPDAEIDAFVREIAATFPAFPLKRDDVTMVHRGVVPAVSDGRGRVRLEGHQLVRDHATGTKRLEGLISVAGTKYTTARAVAEEITDRVIGKLGRPPLSCRTSMTPVSAPVNGDSPVSSDGRTHAVQLPPDVRTHLTAAYGAARAGVLGLIEIQPSLAARLADDMPVIGAQLAWAVRHEMAMTLADAVVRRTPLGALGHPGAVAAARAAAIVGSELAWSNERRDAELDALAAIYHVR